MAKRACPNEETCGGELEFDWEQGDSGDGPWFQSWDYAVLVGQTCDCQLTPEQIEELEKQVTKDSWSYGDF